MTLYVLFGSKKLLHIFLPIFAKNSMRTLILDDEQPAINLLSTFVKKVPFLELQLATVNPFEALEILNQGKTDLLLLDIEMPDISGIEFLKSLSLQKMPAVIFTTAYEQYALQGYELEITDYLVKPIRFERFLKAVNRAKKMHQPLSSDAPKEEFLFVKADYKTVRIALDDILYIEGLKDYVKIITENEKILTRLNLKGISEKLPTNRFIRIHRSFIVSLAKVSAFQKSKISIGKIELPIGETYRNNLPSGFL